MRMQISLLALLVMVSGNSVAAERPQAMTRAMLDLLDRKIADVRPYEPEGLDPGRGLRLYLAPQQLRDGICSSLVITVFVPLGTDMDHLQAYLVSPDAKIRDVRTTTRFKRPGGWLNPTPGGSCGDPAEAGWTIADQAWEFEQAIEVLSSVLADLDSGKPPFRLTCVDYGAPCKDPRSWLEGFLRTGATRVDVPSGGELVATDYHYASAWRTVTVMRGENGAIKQVDLLARMGPLS